MRGARWVVGLGAFGVAIIALWLLLGGDTDRPEQNAMEFARPAWDDIDAKSRADMRDLLRKAGNEE